MLATSIAETSLTIDGVRVVIDSGLARRPHYEPATGLTRLETGRASRASVDQRKGRAGRTQPGVCWRLWDEGETRGLAPFDRPEILDADLAGLVLDLAAWGVADPTALRWLDPPPAPAWREATVLLRDLDALDGDGRLTADGKAMAALPLHPRLAHMLANAGDRARTAAMLAMLLGEQALGGRDVDLRHRLRQFAEDRSPRATVARRMADGLAAQAAGGGRLFDPECAGSLLMLAYPERVAKARGRRGEFLLANGRAGAVDETDALAREDLLAVAEIAGRAGAARILAAAPVAPEDVEAAFAARIHAADEVRFDAAVGGVRARRVRRLGALVLNDAPLDRPDPERVCAALLDGVRTHGLATLPWDDGALQLCARIALLRRLDGETWPDLSDAALLARLEHWLAPALADVNRFDALPQNALTRALAATLSYEQRRRLDAEAPTRFATPAGGDHPIDYAAENGPALDVRLQELFGMATHPSVANGRAPLLLRLLSPAGRPVQTTRDLPGFWTGSYASVRTEMKGRYPRHPWPEDPIAAAPTRRAKPRGS